MARFLGLPFFVGFSFSSALQVLFTCFSNDIISGTSRGVHHSVCVCASTLNCVRHSFVCLAATAATSSATAMATVRLRLRLRQLLPLVLLLQPANQLSSA